jgi:hypothetical protein
LKNLYDEYFTIFIQRNNFNNSNNVTITNEDINNISTKMNVTARIRQLATILKHNHSIDSIIKDSIKLNKHNRNIKKTYVKNIPLDNNTKWNSTYNIIQVTLEFRPLLEYINNNTNTKDFKLLILTDTD